MGTVRDLDLADSQWPADHMGPVSTYMTSCDGDCTKFDASSAKWFKVDASGFTNGKWAATQLIENGNKWTSTIPSELKPGEYVSCSVHAPFFVC